MRRYMFCPDVHFGYERKNGHRVPLHDIRAVNAMLAFAEDFKPEVFILGGDTLDCNPVSHHNKGKPGRVEGLRLLADAQECVEALIEPIEALKAKELYFLTGNHERFLTDLVEEIPGLEDIIDVIPLLHLQKWKVIPQGGHLNLGKLTFIHGDQLKGGEGVAKAAVIAYERNIRFGHYHTYAAFSKNSALEYKLGKTGICVPCLCGKQPRYGQGAPNKWQQGFNFGYVQKDGTFTDYVPIIVDGQFTWAGKVYKG